MNRLLPQLALERLQFKVLRNGAEQRTTCLTRASSKGIAPGFEGVSFAVHETSKGPALAVTVQGQTGISQTAFVTADEIGEAMGKMNDSAKRVVDQLTQKEGEQQQ